MPGPQVVIQRSAEQVFGRQLGQEHLASTAATSLYSPQDGVNTVVKKIHVCNVAGASATIRLFHDEDGSTYDKNTALVWDKTIDANDACMIETYIVMNNSSGNLGIKCDKDDTMTFTAYGDEIQTRAR